MQREFVFTLTSTTATYNLWKDLILPTITDPTFSNSPYIPNVGFEIEIQNQTPGATVLRNGFSLTGGSWDVNRGPVNCLDLNEIGIKTDTNPTSLYVKICAI
jgi:hypothetical protein